MTDPDIELLRRVTVFSVLNDEERERFAMGATRTEHLAGDALTEQGVMGHRFHLIVEGAAEVERNGGHVASLGPGDFLGEVGLLGGGASTATVRCTEPTVCLTIRREEFWAVLQEEPAIALRILEVVCRRLVRDVRPDLRQNLSEPTG